MRTYYLYFIGMLGRIEARQNIDAPDDDAAHALASRENDGRAMELWLGSRKVRAFAARLPES